MDTQQSKWKTRWGLLALVLVVAGMSAIILSACGGSDDSSSTGGETTASGDSSEGASLSGDPVKIMAITPMTAAGGSTIVAPQVGEAAEASAEWINDNGGINGRPLEVTVCDEKGEPNQDAACARQAVSEGAVSIVSYYSTFGEKAYPILEPASIANLGNIPQNPSDGTSQISFPLNGGSAVLVALGQQAAEDPQCKKGTGIVQVQGPAIELVQAGIFGALSVEGGKPGFAISLPPAAQDYSGQANEVANSGECTALFVTSGIAQAFVPALRQVSDAPLLTFEQALDVESIEKLGDQVDGAIVPQYYPLYDDPKLGEYREVIENYSDIPEAQASTYLAKNAYQSVRVFAEVASKVKDLDAKTFLAALSSSKDVSGFGMSPSLNLTKANEWTGVPFQARIFNRNMIYAKIENGELVPEKNGEFQDLTKLGEEAFAPPEG